MIGSRNNNVLALLAVAAFVCISTVAGNSGGIRQGLGKARQLQAGGTPTFSPTTTFPPTAMATTASPTDTYAPTAVATTASPTNTYAPTAMATDPTASPTLTYAPTAMGTTQAPTDTYAPTLGGSSGASSFVTAVVDNSPLQTFTTDDTYPAAVQALMTSQGCPSTGGEVSSGMSCKGDIPNSFQYLNCMYTTKKCLCRNDAPLYLCTRPQ